MAVLSLTASCRRRVVGSDRAVTVAATATVTATVTVNSDSDSGSGSGSGSETVEQENPKSNRNGHRDRMIRVHSLHIYPVKSCRGIDLDVAEIAATGFRYDRQWMVVAPEADFLSQRAHPEMAKVSHPNRR